MGVLARLIVIASVVVKDPPAVVIPIEPVAEPGITITTAVLPSFFIGTAVTPPIVIAVALSRFVPLIVTREPTTPLAGVKPVITGDCPEIFALITAHSSMNPMRLVKLLKWFQFRW
jgi:hypothetical protein